MRHDFAFFVGASDFCRRVIKSSPSLSAWARDDTVRNGFSFMVVEPSSMGTVGEIQQMFGDLVVHMGHTMARVLR